MIKNIFIAACLCIFPNWLHAGDFDKTVTQPQPDGSVLVRFAYAPDPKTFITSPTNPLMQPHDVVWLWGDEEPGARSKNYSIYDYAHGMNTVHQFKPGKYSVTVSIVDIKNRLVKQSYCTVIVQPAAVIQ